jgi:hypothetical protein
LKRDGGGSNTRKEGGRTHTTLKIEAVKPNHIYRSVHRPSCRPGESKRRKGKEGSQKEKGTYGRTEIGICTTQLESSMSDTPSVYRHDPCQGDEERREPLYISSSKGRGAESLGRGERESPFERVESEDGRVWDIGIRRWARRTHGAKEKELAISDIPQCP